MNAPQHQSSGRPRDPIESRARVVARSPRDDDCHHRLFEIVLRGDDDAVGRSPWQRRHGARRGEATTRSTRRRYSVRAVHDGDDTFTLWIIDNPRRPRCSLGSIGQSKVTLVDVVGPRGKILLDGDADWHLFIGDVPVPGRLLSNGPEHRGARDARVFIVEIDDPTTRSPRRSTRESASRHLR